MKKVSIILITLAFVSVALLIKCNKKEIKEEINSPSVQSSTLQSIKNNLPRMIKIENYENAKNSVNLGTFTSGEDYKYFKQNYPTVTLQMNRAEIYSFPDYEGIYAAGIPFEQDGKEGSLIIYKNVSNGKELSIVKSVKREVADTVVRMELLRNPQEMIEITFSKGGSSINLRPGCKDDPNKSCVERCNSWSSCVRCVVNEELSDPLFALTCLVFGKECAIVISIACIGAALN